MNSFRRKISETLTGNGLQPQVLASNHTVFIILCGWRKANIGSEVPVHSCTNSH
jgi:hypothetical protein